MTWLALALALVVAGTTALAVGAWFRHEFRHPYQGEE